jgi:hypothetical protein
LPQNPEGWRTLTVSKLDRPARSLCNLITMIEDFDKRGIHFRSLTEEINTATPGGKLIFHIFGALAEFERGLIIERTREGMKAARAEHQERPATQAKPPADRTCPPTHRGRPAPRTCGRSVQSLPLHPLSGAFSIWAAPVPAIWQAKRPATMSGQRSNGS